MQPITKRTHAPRRVRLAASPFGLLSTTLACVLSVAACNGSDEDNDDGGAGAPNGSGGRSQASGGRNQGSGGESEGSGGRGSGGRSPAAGGSSSGGSSSGGSNSGAVGGANTGGMGMGGDGQGGAAPTGPCDPDDGGIDLPDGFCAVLAAEGLGKARHLTVSPSGDVYVAINPDPVTLAPGRIVALRDTDGDAKLDMRATFNSIGGNGIAWREGELFFAENARIIKYDLPDGQLAPTSEPEVIVSGLPADGDHPSKTLAFSDDGTMFVNIGSATNSCQLANRQLESPGQDPCLELEQRAGVWTFDATVLNQTAEDGERFAAGTRNANALALHPDSDELWAVTNGRDQLYENWPNLYPPSADTLLPSERLLRLEDGEDYGWPYCYHDPGLGMVLSPEYGGDGETTGACAQYPEPDFAFPGHWAPLGAVFYDGDQFPAQYQGGLFVAFHGSRFEPNATGDLPGYQVGFLPFDGDEPGEAFETFASGFAGPNRPLPDEAEARPVSVALANDGSLYITDDYGGNLWRVFYSPDAQ